MKKLLIVTLLFLGITETNSAQRINYGPKVALNIANLYASFTLESSELYTYSFGGFAKINLGKYISIQQEILYSIRGAGNITRVPYDFYGHFGDHKFEYIDFPFLIKLNPNKGFHLEAGPQFGLILGTNCDRCDAKEYFTKTDIGLALGLGYTHESGIDFSIRMIRSINSIGIDQVVGDITPGTFSIRELDLYHGVIQVSLAYEF